MNDNTPGPQYLANELKYYGEQSTEIMQGLPKKLPNFISGMLCTLEGFNICAIGFEEKQISKMAAVSSSLHAMAQSVLEAFSNGADSDLSTVSISSKARDILAKKIQLDNGKTLVLILSSKESNIGIQLYAAKFVEDSLKEKLKYFGKN